MNTCHIVKFAVNVAQVTAKCAACAYIVVGTMLLETQSGDSLMRSCRARLYCILPRNKVILRQHSLCFSTEPMSMHKRWRCAIALTSVSKNFEMSL